jgi:hypothetical protein
VPHLFYFSRRRLEPPPTTTSVLLHHHYISPLPRDGYSDLYTVDSSIQSLWGTPTYLSRVGLACRSSPDLVGFLIVRWLIKERDMDASLASALLAQALPPGITKPKYLLELGRLSGSPVTAESIAHASDRLLGPPPRKNDLPLELRALCAPARRGGGFPGAEYAPFGPSAIERVAADRESTYTIVLEPRGPRGILCARGRECGLFLDGADTRTFALVPAFSRALVVEGVLTDDTPFVVGDIVADDGRCCGARAFGERMARVERAIPALSGALGGQPLRLEPRRFYAMAHWAKVFACFRGARVFRPYRPRGIVVTAFDSRSPVLFAWDAEDDRRPRVIAVADYARMRLFGHAVAKTTSRVVACLDPVDRETRALNGCVVEIRVIRRDQEFDKLVNARIVRAVEGEIAWTAEEFLRCYPDREPHLPIEAIEAGLERIAQLPQYAQAELK